MLSVIASERWVKYSRDARAKVPPWLSTNAFYSSGNLFKYKLTLEDGLLGTRRLLFNSMLERIEGLHSGKASTGPNSVTRKPCGRTMVCNGLVQHSSLIRALIEREITDPLDVNKIMDQFSALMLERCRDYHGSPGILTWMLWTLRPCIRHFLMMYPQNASAPRVYGAGSRLEPLAVQQLVINRIVLGNETQHALAQELNFTISEIRILTRQALISMR